MNDGLVTPAPDPQQRLMAARDAADHLARLHGARELQAAVLALLLPSGSHRAARAWALETASTPNAAALREHVGALPGSARLPWFEVLVTRMRSQPLAARQDLLEATRRLMGARGAVRPIDRLHWLVMRQRLGGAPGVAAPCGAASDLWQLPQAMVVAIATYSAFLSRMVPVDAPEGVAAIETPPCEPVPPGAAWYDAVMLPWRPHAAIPCRQVPDGDGLVHALQELQTLAWMQRPVLLRGWVAAALQHSRHGRLTDNAADALRMSGTLLDSPLHPDLVRHFHEVAAERAR